MSKQVQRRRGTASQHTSFTGADGEISVNTTNKSVHVHDGVTTGGIEAARADLGNVSSASVLGAAGITATAAELNYTDGVTSSIQTQLNTKAPINNATFTGTTVVPTADINGGSIDGTVIGGSTPAAISGTTITGTSFVTTGDMTFGDNDKAIFGAGSDLQIYHDGSDSYIADTATGSLHIKGTSLFLEDADGNEFIRMSDQGSGGIVYLKNLGATKLATTATGIDVTGTVTADGLTVDGAISQTVTAGTVPIDIDTNISSSEGSVDIIKAKTVNDEYSAITLDRLGSTQTGLTFKTTNASTLAPRLKISNEGDISFYEDTGTTPKFFWDASAESLGIGTAAPTNINGNSTLLEVSAPSGTAEYILRGSTAVASWWAGSSAANIGTTTNHPLNFHTNGLERLRLDSSGNVLIGQTVIPTGLGASNTKLILGSFEDGPEFVAYNSDNDIQVGDKVGAFLFGNDDNNATEDHFAGMWAKSASTTGAMDIHFAAGNANYETDSPHMTITSSGNVGIGAAVPTSKLDVAGTVTATAFAGPLTAANLSGTVPDASISGSYTGMTNLTGTGTVDFAKFLGNAADTAAAPSFSWTGDTNTGIYQPAADQLGFSTGGTSRFTLTTSTITSTLPILGAAGSAAAPAFSRSGDTNTGMWFPAADTIAFSEGGTEVIRINSSSNVGIGTDDPASKLDVAGVISLNGLATKQILNVSYLGDSTDYTRTSTTNAAWGGTVTYTPVSASSRTMVFMYTYGHILQTGTDNDANALHSFCFRTNAGTYSVIGAAAGNVGYSDFASGRLRFNVTATDDLSSSERYAGNVVIRNYGSVDTDTTAGFSAEIASKTLQVMFVEYI